MWLRLGPDAVEIETEMGKVTMKNTRRILAMMLSAMMLVSMPFTGMLTTTVAYGETDALVVAPIDPDATPDEPTGELTGTEGTSGTDGNAADPAQATTAPTAVPTEVPAAPVEPLSIRIVITPAVAEVGQQVNLSASVSGGTDNLSYQWQWANMSEAAAQKLSESGAKSDSVSGSHSEREANTSLNWHDEPGATGLNYSFTATEDNLNRYWRLQVKMVMPEESSDSTGISAIRDYLFASALADTVEVFYSSYVGNSISASDDNKETTVPTVSIANGAANGLQVGGTAAMLSVALTEGASVSDYTWTWSVDSGSEFITLASTTGAEVSVSAVSAGTAVVRVKADGMDGMTAIANVVVSAASSDESKPSEETGTENPTTPAISISASASSINIGDTADISLANVPENATVVWSVDNQTVVGLDSKGNNTTVTGIEAGTATVQASVDGTPYSVSIEVVKPQDALAVSISPLTASLEVGESVTLSLSNVPDGTSVSWAVTNGANVATIAANGNSCVVTAVSAGTTSVGAVVDGTTYESEITVKQPAITMEPAAANVTIPDSVTLSLKNVPEGAKITWSDPSEFDYGVMYDQTGSDTLTVMAVKTGDYRITADVDGVKYTADISVRGEEIVNLMTMAATTSTSYAEAISPTTATMVVGQTLPFEIAGGNATTKYNIVKGAGDTDAIKLDYSGTGKDFSVTALKPGTVEIWHQKDGSTQKATITIKRVFNTDTVYVYGGSTVDVPLALDSSVTDSMFELTGLVSSVGSATANMSSMTASIYSVQAKTSAYTVTAHYNGDPIDSIKVIMFTFSTNSIMESGANSLEANESVTVNMTTIPATLNKEFAWSVDNQSVIQLSNSGLTSSRTVSAVGKGTATLSVELLGTTKTYDFSVGSVKIDPSSLPAGNTIVIGQPHTIYATVDSSYTGLSWKVGDDYLVHSQTSNSMTFTGKAPGDTVIELWETGGTAPLDSVTITVAQPSVTVPSTMTVGDTGTISLNGVQVSSGVRIEWNLGAAGLLFGNVSENNSISRTVSATGAGTANVVASVYFANSTNPVATAAGTILISSANSTTQTLGIGGTFTMQVNNPNARWSLVDASGVPVTDVLSPSSISDGTQSVTFEAKKVGNVTVIVIDSSSKAEIARCVVTVADVPVTSVQIVTGSRTSLYYKDSATPADTSTFTATVYPVNASNKSVVWTSSNTAVATVDSTTGVVTAVGPGTAQIRATAAGNTARYATTYVTVRQVAQKIEFTTDRNVSLTAGQTHYIRATAKAYNSNGTSIYPANPSLVYAIDGSTTSAITLSSSGAVTANQVSAPTTVRVKVTTKDVPANMVVTEYVDFEIYPATTRVSIHNADDGDSLLSTYGFDFSEVGKTVNLKAIVKPDAADQTVTWRSSNSNLVSVSSTGQIRLERQQAGTATITATTLDKKQSASITVTVSNQMKAISISGPDPMEVAVNRNITLTATITPTSPTYRNLKWTSSDTTVATVSGSYPNATVYGRAAGTVVITAEATDGSGVTASVTVKVLPAITGLTIVDSDSMPLTGSQKMDLDATPWIVRAVTLPSNASQNVTWRSSNPNVAVVTPGANGTCTITPGSIGYTTITATTSDGSRSASFNLQISKWVSDIIIEGPDEVAIGRSITLKATTNANASSRNVTWSSSNESIARVSGGTVTGVMSGEVEIIATATDGSGYFAKKTIKVTAAATRVAIVTASDNRVISEAFFDLNDNPLQVMAQVYPASVSQNVTWRTSNASVAAIDVVGDICTVTPARAGTATITATSADGSNIMGTLTVTVGTRASNIYITGGTSVIGGNNLQLTANVTPSTATNNQVNWKVVNADANQTETSFATIAGTGYNGATATLTTKKVDGKVTLYVYATLKDGSLESAPYTVTILPPTSTLFFQDANGNSITSLTIDMNLQNLHNVTAVVSPSTASGEVTWTSSNPAVAAIVDITNHTQSGASGDYSRSTAAIRGLKTGTATITATSQDGSRVTGSFTVRVNTVATNVYPVGNENVGMLAGQSKQFSVLITPADAVYKEVVWSSGDKSIADVNAITGVVTAVAPGTTSITARLKEDMSQTVTYTVTVTSIPKKLTVTTDGSTPISNPLSIGFSPTSLEAVLGDANGNPLSANVVVRTANSMIASVSNQGNGSFTITGKQAGSTLITVTSTENSSLYVKFLVTVR